ncbi:MAG: hypothetical protein HDS84_08520 [Bacteroidales bacterium]|nr:hypothetical protein [Bacteroidales bacterium]MBD5206398.1 hypothetical protein [Bacteroidales bacterium]
MDALPDKCRDVACHVWGIPSVIPYRNIQTWHATSLHLPPHFPPQNIDALPDECRDVACHVWEIPSVIPPRNIQTWHATSLHLPLHYLPQRSDVAVPTFADEIYVFFY